MDETCSVSEPMPVLGLHGGLVQVQSVGRTLPTVSGAQASRSHVVCGSCAEEVGVCVALRRRRPTAVRTAETYSG